MRETPMNDGFKDKTLAAALAMVGGMVGAHRFYLRGWRDPLAWVLLPLLAAGVWGAQRFLSAGPGDPGARVALPLLGLALGLALFQAVLIGLTPDARWDARWNPGSARRSASGWGAVLVIAVSLLAGAAALMGSLAYFLLQSFAMAG